MGRRIFASFQFAPLCSIGGSEVAERSSGAWSDSRGRGIFSPADRAGTLKDYVDVKPSPEAARISAGNVVLNDVDAAAAGLVKGVHFQQKLLALASSAGPQWSGSSHTERQSIQGWP